MAQVTVQTKWFGAQAVGEDRVYEFRDGLLGFASVRRFALLEHPGKAWLEWLQSTETAALAFAVCDPRPFFPDYRVGVRQEDLAALRLGGIGEAQVRVILTVPPPPGVITANLLGPVILNPRERIGRQMVLTDSGFTTRHPLFPAAPPPEGR